ncbi:MAG: chaperone NapD [Nitrospirota bacterium]|jgi:nitrate reductase NapAB chaperone NapD
MDISGVLVQVVPGRERDVVAAIREKAGVEVHEILSGGKVVLTIETDTPDDAHDIAAAIRRLPGVLSTDLAFHYFDGDQNGRLDPALVESFIENERG